MSFEASNINWSANQVASMMKNGKIITDNVIQRSCVWEKQRKSLFIHSLALSFPVPAVYAKRNFIIVDDKEVKQMDILDGKQRLSTIKQFLNNEFELTDLEPVTFFDDIENQEVTVDISGMKFEDLTEGMQEKIKNARVSVVYFDNLEDGEENELFKRLNNGKPLTTKNKALASCKDLRNIIDIGKADLFEDMLTDKAKANKTQVPIIMKMWIMLNNDVNDISFAAKDFNPILETTEISNDQREQMEEMFDYIMNVHTLIYDCGEKKIAKKFYTETHLISLIPFIKEAIDNGYSEEWFMEWIEEFFGTDEGTSISDEYNIASSNAAAKTSQIVARNEALRESFDEFFSKEKDEDDSDWEESSDDYDDSEDDDSECVEDDECDYVEEGAA